MPPDAASGGGTSDPYRNVDPNGLQAGSTASTTVGLGLVAASGAGGSIASALGLGTASTKILTAGISLQAMGHVSLFSAGLVLIGLGIVLNVASLVVRRQMAREYERVQAVYEEERKKNEEKTSGR